MVHPMTEPGGRHSARICRDVWQQAIAQPFAPPCADRADCADDRGSNHELPASHSGGQHDLWCEVPRSKADKRPHCSAQESSVNSCRKTPRHSSSSATAFTASVPIITVATGPITARRFGTSWVPTAPATGSRSNAASPIEGRRPFVRRRAAVLQMRPSRPRSGRQRSSSRFAWRSRLAAHAAVSKIFRASVRWGSAKTS